MPPSSAVYSANSLLGQLPELNALQDIFDVSKVVLIMWIYAIATREAEQDIIVINRHGVAKFQDRIPVQDIGSPL